MNLSIVVLGVAVWLGQGASPGVARPFELVNGDRVVLIGGTFVERDQAYGYLETRLTRRYPDRSITFRNLGWSGDTVGGLSRARFGTPADGFKHLVDHVKALEPSVIILGYGANEAFEGQAGLPSFLQGLWTLLTAIEPTKARLVFLAPTRQENLGPPLPDPTRHNADLMLYRDALKAVAETRHAAFVDLFDLLPDTTKDFRQLRQTDNGIHLNPYGYWRAAFAIQEGLEIGRPEWSIDLGPVDRFVGTKVSDREEKPGVIRFRLLDEVLPPPSSPNGLSIGGDQRHFRKLGLAPGQYVLKIDGQVVGIANAEGWAAGVVLGKGPEFDQTEALRSAIIAKNELYFYRWRPQNETYLFGFRKHEQGQNAREIPEFDPLIAAREAEIARLRVPVPHVYELTREGGVAR